MSTLPLWRRALLRLAGGIPTPEKRSIFAGAQVNRLTSDFFTGGTGPRTEVRFELRALRDRARDLERNNAYARRILALTEDNVVGHRGIRLQAQARKADGSLDRATNRHLEERFAEWGRRETCTVTGRQSWVEVQKAVIRAVKRDGECFVRHVTGAPRNPFGYAVQLLDADQFDETYGYGGKAGTRTVVMSVELDEWDRPTRYFMWTASPNETMAMVRERVPIDAADIIHLFRPRRAGQVRGETWFAPVMLALKMLDGYSESALNAARVAAAKMGFIEQSAEDGVVESGPASPQYMEASPGVIDRLGPGEKFASWDPAYPTGEYGPFTQEILHQIAAGVNISHASMTGNLSQVNYSSGRMGQLPERDYWRGLQLWLSETLCDQVYRRWLRAASLTGAISLPSERLAEYERVAWRPRGWKSVDPLKDVQADALAVAFGFTTRGRVVADDGEDLEELIELLAHEQQMIAEAGLTLATPNTVQLATETAGGTDGTDAGSATDNAGRGRPVPVRDDRARPAVDARGGGRPLADLSLLRAAGGAVVRP